MGMPRSPQRWGCQGVHRGGDAKESTNVSILSSTAWSLLDELSERMGSCAMTLLTLPGRIKQAAALSYSEPGTPGLPVKT